MSGIEHPRLRSDRRCEGAGQAWRRRADRSSPDQVALLNQTFTPASGKLTATETLGNGNFCWQRASKQIAQGAGGDPVNTATGNFSETYTDLAIPGRGVPLVFSRTYNSLAASTVGPLGFGWTFDYQMSLTFGYNSATVVQEKAGRPAGSAGLPLAPLQGDRPRRRATATAPALADRAQGPGGRGQSGDAGDGRRRGCSLGRAEGPAPGPSSPSPRRSAGAQGAAALPARGRDAHRGLPHGDLRREERPARALAPHLPEAPRRPRPRPAAPCPVATTPAGEASRREPHPPGRLRHPAAPWLSRRARRARRSPRASASPRSARGPLHLNDRLAGVGLRAVEDGADVHNATCRRSVDCNGYDARRDMEESLPD
jgi:Domain of unknown function (DUF6531)